MQQKNFSIIILAGGKGTRMKTALPKVLHPVLGEPMILRPIRAAKKIGADEVRVVVGHGRELVNQVILSTGAISKVQNIPMGTADAVKSAEPETMRGDVMIINGDHPLIDHNDLAFFLEKFRQSEAKVAVVTCVLDNPGSFGRIVRHNGELKAIVEAKDASHDTLAIKEINTGLYVAKAETLAQYIPQIKNENAQNEYYLTDIISLATSNGDKVIAIQSDPHVAFGVNSQQELSMASEQLFLKKIQQLQDQGVIVISPTNTFVEENVSIGASTVLYPGVYLRGSTTIGEACVLEPNVYIEDSKVENGCTIKAGSYIEKSHIGASCSIGPYAHLRPESVLGEEVKIGNFVETKKAKLEKGVKASHLTYLGDCEIGEGTNIGCGTITCNYAADHKKYKTKIGKNVFVGSDSQFVAPVEVGDGAIIGSGSTITKDVPSDSLAVARARQFIKEGYANKFKK